jgi:hypothetical protein
MDIKEIDNMLDEVLDKFMYEWIMIKNKNLIKYDLLFKTKDYSKYQKELNDMLEFSENFISNDEVNKLVSKNSNVLLIKNVMLKYLSYYLYILIGLNYENKIEDFNNNLIEITNSQTKYSVKIDNFFNSESNSNIIKIVNLLNELIENKKNKSDECQYLIDKIGNDKIEELMKNYKKNKMVVFHNLIKISIFLILFKIEEKKEIFFTIDNSETLDGEFMFIDIVVPKHVFIDFEKINQILEYEQLETDIPNIIYDMLNINQSEDIYKKKKNIMDLDTKIQKLFESQVIIPITDDFLLYHKNNEKYEFQNDKNNGKNGKKENTKIKYIVDKINVVADYHKDPNEIKNMFYAPKINQYATAINKYENMKITSKMSNLTTLSNQNLDLYNEFTGYMNYPNVPFKYLNNHYFLHMNVGESYNVIRNSSFEMKKYNKNVETRILSYGMMTNIIGFAISTNNDIEKLSPNDFIIVDEENPVIFAQKIIKEKIYNSMRNKNIAENYVLIFSKTKKYRLKGFDENIPQNDIIKLIFSHLYDFYIEENIKSMYDYVKSNDAKTLIEYKQDFEMMQLKIPDILDDRFSKKISELEYLMYKVKSLSTNKIDDESENTFTGLYDNVYKLPTYVKKDVDKTATIIYKIEDKEMKFTRTILESMDYQEEIPTKTNDYISGVCQHNITWNKLLELKKNKSLLYSNLIYEYIQQFVTVNKKQDYICKSCKCELPIKKSIQDGYFDSKIQKFVTYSINMNVNIEQLSEYEQYKIAIRNIDKIIERIAIIIDLIQFSGTIYSARNKRKSMVKDTIELLIYNNEYLKKHYRQIKTQKRKLHGINDKLTVLFDFELSNDIFVYSSKDKDFYKIMKYNNTLCYIIILIILELNDNQILHLTESQKDNKKIYELYVKIHKSLFENFKIIVNKQHDVEPILNYPIMCYLIYIISYYIIKFSLWGSVETNEDNVKMDIKKIVGLQKVVINTIIELFNTVLMVNVNDMKENKIYLYQNLQSKYYAKLHMYKDMNLVKKIKNEFSNSSKNIENEIVVDSKKFDIKPTESIENKLLFDNLFNNIARKLMHKRMYFIKPKPKHLIINKISNLTNCIDGYFHKFDRNIKSEHIGNNFICKYCNQSTDLAEYVKDSTEFIDDKQTLIQLRTMAQKFGVDGHIHNFNQNNLCNFCKYQRYTLSTLTDDELKKMFQNIEKIRIKKSLYIEKHLKNLNNELNEKSDKIKKIFDKIMYKFQKTKDDITISINNLMDSIQKLVGIEIVINKNLYNLYDDIYIINHNYNGTNIDNPITEYEKNGNIKIIENHIHFKHDIIVYTMHKKTKYELFYDLHSKYLIGYRELNKKIVNIVKTDARLQINYSIKNMFLMFGFARENMSIKDYYSEFYGMSEEEYQNSINNPDIFTMNKFANKISDKRFCSIKSLGRELQKFFNRIKYNYTVELVTIKKESGEIITDSVENNPLDIIYVKYKKKFNEIKLIKDNHEFLKYMNTINTYLTFDENKQKISFKKHINYNYMLKHDFINNLTLNYIIDEINRLIEYNPNKVVKTNIVNFILEIFVNLFDSFNYDISKFDKDINMFNQILYTSSTHLSDADLPSESIDFYKDSTPGGEISEEEQIKVNENKIDEQEEQDSYDMEDGNGEDIEDAYDNNMENEM